MTREQVQGILRRHSDALNNHDVPALEALYAGDAVLESPMLEIVRDRPAIAESFERLFGLFPDYSMTTTFPSESLQLAPGDSLLLYSDGVSEAVSPAGEQFDVDQLMAAVADHAAARRRH